MNTSPLHRCLILIGLLLTLIGCEDGCAPPGPHPEDFDSSCQFCHQNTEDALEEEAHPWASLSCVDCHGGNKDAFTQEEAHVPRPAMVTTSYRHLATEQMNALDSDYLRFVNPGDLRVAEISCGSKKSTKHCRRDRVPSRYRRHDSTFSHVYFYGPLQYPEVPRRHARERGGGWGSRLRSKY